MKTNVFGVLAGIAAGAVLGVLFAPQSGSKTRKKIKEKTIDTKDSLKQEFDNFLDSVSEEYSTIADAGKTLIKDEKEVLKKAANKVASNSSRN